MLYKPPKDRRRKDYKKIFYFFMGATLGYYTNDLASYCCTARAETEFSNFNTDKNDDPLSSFDRQSPPKIAVIEEPEPEYVTLDVPKAAIKRGEKITAASLTDQDFPLNEINSDQIVTREEMIGKIAKTYLRAGEPIEPQDLAAPILVKRNQKVKMIFEKAGLYIVTEGRALDNAGAGETVKVMNEAGKTVVTGAVTAQGEVRVGM